MHKEDFDKWFDDAFDQLRDKSDIPDYRPSWDKVKKSLKIKEKRRMRNRMFRNVSVIAASMLLGAILFSSTPITTAFNPFYQTIKQLPGDIVTIFFGNEDNTYDDAKTLPPANEYDNSNLEVDIGPTEIITTSFEQARDKANFTLPAFSYIPHGYQFEKTELFMTPGEDLSKKVRFTFRGQSNALWVTFIQLENNMTITSGSTKANVEEIEFYFGIGYLTLAHDGSSKIEVLKGDIYISVLGYLEKDELIRFMENM